MEVLFPWEDCDFQTAWNKSQENPVVGERRADVRQKEEGV